VLLAAFAGAAIAAEPDFLLANRGPGFTPEVMWISAVTLEATKRAGADARAIGPMPAAAVVQRLQRGSFAFSRDGCSGVPTGSIPARPPQVPVSLEKGLAKEPISFIVRVEQRDIGWELVPEYGDSGVVAARLQVRVIEILRDETGKLREGAPLTMLQDGGSFVLDSVRFCTIDREAQPVSVGDTLFATATASDLESPYLPSPPRFFLRGGVLVPVGREGWGRMENIPLEKVRKRIGQSPKR